MPSNAGQSAPPLRSPFLSRPRRKKRRRLALALAIIVLIPVAAAGLLKSGMFAPLLEREAVASLARVLPETLEARIGEASVGVDGFDGIGVSLDRFTLVDRQSGEEVFGVEEMRIGVRTLSALRGKPQIRKLTLSGGDIALSRLTAGDGAPPTIAGIEPALANLFDSANRLFDRTTLNGMPVHIAIADMRLRSGDEDGDDIVIREAEVLARKGQRALDADIDYGGQPVRLAGILRRGDANAMSVWLTAEGWPMPLGRLRTIFSAIEADHETSVDREPIPSFVRIAARRTPGDVPDELSLSVEPDDFRMKLDEDDFITVGGRFNFDWTPENRVLSLTDSPVRFGRSSAILTGGVRDAPAEAGERSYQFELIGNEGVSDPMDSPEPPVKFAMRAQGGITPEAGKVEFSRIEIDSEAGYAEGAGTLDFAAEVPNAIFAISIRDFALAGVKQFWPGSVGRAARRWVLANLAGGRVSEGEFFIAEPLRRRIPGSEEKLQGDTELELQVEGVRFDVTGDIPPVRDASGQVSFNEGTATITLDSGTAFLPSGRTAAASDGTLVIHPENADGLVFADLDVQVSGEADALGELISFRPISARQFRDYEPEELSGDVDARVGMRFVLNPREGAPAPDWNVALDVRDAAISTPFEGRILTEMTGRIAIDRQHADINVTGRIDGLPAEIDMVQPFGDALVEASRDIVLKLDDADRRKLAPGLETLVTGTTPVTVKSQAGEGEAVSIDADLSAAALSLPWIGWSKGSGIPAKTAFDLLLGESETRITDFRLDGGTFSADGEVTVGEAGVKRARFSQVRLNDTDDIAVSIDRNGRGYTVAITGSSFDARALIRHIRKEMSSTGEGDGTPVTLTARIAAVRGFGDETMRDVDVTMRHDGANLTELTVSATSAAGFPVSFRLSGTGAERSIRLEALDGGEVLRFVDIYGQVRGGVLTMALSGSGANQLTGKIDLNDFRIFNEPRLTALVSSRSGQTASLSEAIQRDIDTREVKFDRASATLNVGPSSLRVTNAIVRGPEVGATFQGTVYDKNNRMRIAGTFMPAYAVNSLLSNVPVLGLVLGNGRDRGLIGVTFLLEGDTKQPKITVNPLSVIAPGLFRSIFEFR